VPQGRAQTLGLPAQQESFTQSLPERQSELLVHA